VGDERFAYLAQTYLMDELGDLNQSLRFFAQLRDRLGQKLEKLREIERNWAAADPRYPDQLSLTDFHVQLTLRSGLLSLASKVKWCTESIRRIHARIRKGTQNGRSLSRTSLAAHRRGRGGAVAVLDSRRRA
jgi:hypothetical protein